MIEDEFEVLKNLSMFAQMDRCRLRLLAFSSESLRYQRGDFLFHQHDAADCVYVILNGEVAILAKDPKHPPIARGVGDLIGEVAVFSRANRSASVQVTSDEVQALRIDEATFCQLISENPSVARDVIRQLSDKLHQQTETY